jgi:hypothetical protein
MIFLLHRLKCRHLTAHVSLSIFITTKWLWEVHNDISSYKLKKEVAKFDAFGRKDEAKQWERDMKVLFPQMDQCNGCITTDGTWNLNAVYNHLEYEYW